jgi:hypothetical protein
MTAPTFACGLPHTPWVPERARSFERLTEALWNQDARGTVSREFTERASNRVWPRAMWGWALTTDASYFLTLQDDVLIAPFFWDALRAMVVAQPSRIIGLSAVHPMAGEIARGGQRWYRTRSWLVGWAYVLPRADLAEFVAWFDRNPERVAATNEDTLLNEWIAETGRETWHPVPSIVDHDTSIGSTYSNDAHLHRRTTVTWRGHQEADLVSHDFWRDNGGPLLGVPQQGLCWACSQQPARVKATSGVGLCTACLVLFMGTALGVAMSTTGGAK